MDRQRRRARPDRVVFSTSCGWLHVGRDKVYYLLRTGQLRSIKIGKLRRITDRHLAEFVAALEDSNA